VPVSHVEARTPGGTGEALRAYAAQGYGLVFAHGYEFQDAARARQREYPRTIFIVTSGARTRHNVVATDSSAWKRRATSLAWWPGRLTKSNVIGFVGGVELPPVKAAYEGWVNGARSVNRAIASRSTLPEQLGRSRRSGAKRRWR
jgi:basic membrane lipoprotein Med (substrate-binding protein (PBP1-ABC) superfamily)